MTPAGTTHRCLSDTETGNNKIHKEILMAFLSMVDGARLELAASAL